MEEHSIKAKLLLKFLHFLFIFLTALITKSFKNTETNVSQLIVAMNEITDND